MEKHKSHMMQRLVQQIEKKLGWGSGLDWTNKDFENLSESIFEATKKRLSVTTLKRIWGRAEMVARPSAATLDILSEFIGYQSWRNFTVIEGKQGQSAPYYKNKFIKPAIIIVLLIGVTALTAFFWPQKRVEVKPMTNVEASDFAFETKVVSMGLPNSVVFKYDATSASPDAKIEIQQDWDERKRIQINRNDSIATCIYYRPGFFKSKLVVDGSIVQEEDVFIASDGWLGTINKDAAPIYLNQDEIVKGNEIGIDAKALSVYEIDPKINETTTSLYYIDDFSGIYTNDFKASLEVLNTMDNALGGCQEIDVYMLYDGGAIGIPLARKGCISKLNVMAFDQYVNGKKNDLSSLGVEFDTYEKLSFGAENDVFRIWVNDDLAYELPVVNPAKAIKGVSVHFTGTGSIRNMMLNNTRGINHQFN